MSVLDDTLVWTCPSNYSFRVLIDDLYQVEYHFDLQTGDRDWSCTCPEYKRERYCWHTTLLMGFPLYTTTARCAWDSRLGEIPEVVGKMPEIGGEMPLCPACSRPLIPITPLTRDPCPEFYDPPLVAVGDDEWIEPPLKDGFDKDGNYYGE